MRARKQLPVPQVGLPSEVPVQRRPVRRNVNVPTVVAALVADLHVEMPGAPPADIVAELLSRLETVLPGVTFNHDALRAHAESIHRAGQH
jgi:hypothetical protein